MSRFIPGVAPSRQPFVPFHLLILAAAALLAAGGGATSAAKAQTAGRTPVAVLELFTSQGCSSCPPADALFARLARREGILALTMPVNYWDHLGWKDTLAKDVFTERQRAYADARGDREIYTPQLVVNGSVHVIGSRPEDIENALRRTTGELAGARVPLEVRNDGKSVLVQAGAGAPGSVYRSGTVRVACYTRSVQVDIRRGENHGTRITYTNVVRSLQDAGRWNGEAVAYHIPIPHGANIDGCAAFLEADGSKAMLGAAVMHLVSD